MIHCENIAPNMSIMGKVYIAEVQPGIVQMLREQEVTVSDTYTMFKMLKINHVV